MKVCVMGLGYIGFPTACIIAEAGHDVLGVDVKQSLVDSLNAGELHIQNEEGLEQLARSVRVSGRMRIGSSPETADVFIIAVPTPFQHENELDTLRAQLERPETSYHADITYVIRATEAIVPFVKPGNLIVVESTVPPHTTDQAVVRTLSDHGVDPSGILFAHAPERVLPGNIVHELVFNDRIVGGVTKTAGEAAAEFYRSFVKGEVLLTNATTAELVKLMENTFRDVNIALANEFAIVCETLGVDVWEAIGLANRHPRVKFLKPGPGVGGHCIAVDPYFVVEAAPSLTQLVQAARRVNRRMPLHILDLFSALTAGEQVKRVALLGASYKANVGDDRESPALEVGQLLEESGFEVSIHDPYVPMYARPVLEVLSGADAIVLVTDHLAYQELAPSAVAQVVAKRLLLDARGCLAAADWRRAGFKISQLGTTPSRETLALAGS